MEKIILEATERTPYVALDHAAHHMVMRGESYPEDAAAFFGPLQQALRSFLDSPDGDQLVVDLELSYFNSSSAKALMNLFVLLEQAASEGSKIQINWRFHKDDDTMQEFGEDFAEDFEHASFVLCPLQDA